MAVDLDSMSLKELEKLRKNIDKAIARLEVRRKDDARKAAEEAARQFGFSLDELTDGKKPKKTSPPKYRNPEDPKQTWTGRGRQPRWIKDAIEAGRPMSDFEI
ncbi:DNA-binding protein H-NS [Rhodovulum iodosum]|uniref:DNA-binding protein H-NS n=1 Tax=Rhodovulum iodosum TaxID=68291 RepID=A0ABV3XSF5_9RHOB|nr:H-NS histone family protein [Rhodovulum robiginosum]RSK30575.1 H-NS histone family protein [Rhodovulum robiginosum]